MSDTLARDEAAKAFAVELVALARKHGANHMALNFDMTGHTEDWKERDKWHRGSINLTWQNGRHGDKEKIRLSYEASVSLLESDGTP